MSGIGSSGIAPPVRAQLVSVLAELVPLWIAEDPRDWKRVVRPLGAGQFSINIESYRGIRTWIAFQKKLEGRQGLQALESAIRKNQPELLGYISYPGRTQLIQDVKGLTVCWCQAVAEYMKGGASVQESTNRVIKELDGLLSLRRLTHEVLTPLAGLDLPEDVERIPLSDGVFL